MIYEHLKAFLCSVGVVTIAGIAASAAQADLVTFGTPTSIEAAPLTVANAGNSGVDATFSVFGLQRAGDTIDFIGVGAFAHDNPIHQVSHAIGWTISRPDSFAIAMQDLGVRVDFSGLASGDLGYSNFASPSDELRFRTDGVWDGGLNSWTVTGNPNNEILFGSSTANFSDGQGAFNPAFTDANWIEWEYTQYLEIDSTGSRAFNVTLDAVSVPEPSSLPIFAAVAVWLGVRRWSRG